MFGAIVHALERWRGADALALTGFPPVVTMVCIEGGKERRSGGGGGGSGGGGKGELGQREGENAANRDEQRRIQGVLLR